MAELLYTDRYVKPGCYIGQLIEPSSNLASASRIPTAIGKGSRYALSTNAVVTRSYVDSLDITFTGTVPYTATLPNAALKDQDKAVLIRDGYEIPVSKWYFADTTHIIISDDEYVANASYKFSYQSTDATLLDPAPVNDISSFTCVGDTPDADKYIENKDYFLVMETSEITKKDGSSQEKISFDERYEAESLFPEAEGPDNTPGFGSLIFDVSEYKGEVSAKYSFKVKSVDAAANSIVLSCVEGEAFAEAGSIDATVKADGKLYRLSENSASVFYGMKAYMSSISSFVVGNLYEGLEVTPGKIFMTAKDNRVVNLRVTKAPTDSLAGEIYYTSNTPEGGFGVVELDGTSGTIILPGNVILKYTGLVKDEEYKFSLTNTNKISWGLTRLANETFKPAEIYNDVNGSVTGTFGAYYISVSGTPIEGTDPVIYGLTDGIVATPVKTEDGFNTTYVTFSKAGIPAKPKASVTAMYEYKGAEPEPGAVYYVSTTHVRPDSFYNKVMFISSRDEGRRLLAPATPNNELYIANEIAWDELGSKAGAQVAIVQVKDSDCDGVYSPDDVKAAIDGCAKSKAVTDLTLLGCFDQFGYLLRMNQDANDPFALRENEVWAGCPVGTPIGSVNDEGSLVYTAKSTMKVYGDDPAHGTRILVGSTWAKRSVTMSSGKSQEVTMDGSFIAWALCCMRCSLSTADSILRKTLISFSDMEIHDDVDNDKLGAAQIVYFSKAGTGVYRVEEDFTVDTYGFEFSIEQITSQRLMAVRRIRAFVDENLVGVTPDTPQAGITLVTSFLVRALNTLISEGSLSAYLDENGNRRPLDVSKDIFVQNVKNNPTQYQFGYGLYTKKVAKQFFGTYVVDRDFSSTGLGNV